VAAAEEAAQGPPTCAGCGVALTDQFYRVNQQQNVCPNCAAQVGALEQSNRFAFGPWTMGAIAGFVVAVICGFLWALIVKLTDYELGLAAIGVGLGVSWAVMKASGGRRGPSIQFLTIAFSILGIIIGKGLTVTWAFWDQVKPTGPEVADTPEWFLRLLYFLLAPIVTFGFFDILWYGFAIYEAWKLPRAFRVQMDGPYSIEAADDAEGMQFDRVAPPTPPHA
jgi:hypothetical protein